MLESYFALFALEALTKTRRIHYGIYMFTKILFSFSTSFNTLVTKILTQTLKDRNVVDSSTIIKVADVIMMMV